MSNDATMEVNAPLEAKALRLWDAAVVNRWIVTTSVGLLCAYVVVGGALMLCAGVPLAPYLLWSFALAGAVVQVQRARRWAADPLGSVPADVMRRNIRGWKLSLGLWLGIPLLLMAVMRSLTAPRDAADIVGLAEIGAAILVLLAPLFLPSILAAAGRGAILRRHDARHPAVRAALVNAARSSATLDEAFAQAQRLLSAGRWPGSPGA